jgi:hypothetical protein
MPTLVWDEPVIGDGARLRRSHTLVQNAGITGWTTSRSLRISAATEVHFLRSIAEGDIDVEDLVSKDVARMAELARDLRRLSARCRSSA